MPLPHPTDEPDANTLPDPELNPLINPLLAANMGRWAEVYFTTPPEQRGEAVSELLRELRNSSHPELTSGQVIKDKSEEKIAAEEADSAAAEPLGICGACAHENPAEERFCGMCGASLQISPEGRTPYGDPEPTLGGEFPQYAIDAELHSKAASGGHNERKAAWPLPEQILPSFAVQSEPESVPSRYRLYVGAVLALLLPPLIYVYMAARSTKTISDAPGTQFAASRNIPLAPPPAPPAGPAGSAQPSTTQRIPPEENSSASPAVPSVRSKSQPAATSRRINRVGARRASTIVTMAASSYALAADASGAQDLATAEMYLNGTQGMPRDRREAAQWLWKAVGKGNVAATTTLSDLYLRGDGVPKNCDQARLLLDAAARKGGRAAATRLGHLQAFDCD
jgi:Sel1 repeat